MGEAEHVSVFNATHVQAKISHLYGALYHNFSFTALCYFFLLYHSKLCGRSGRQTYFSSFLYNITFNSLDYYGIFSLYLQSLKTSLSLSMGLFSLEFPEPWLMAYIFMLWSLSSSVMFSFVIS